MFPGAAIGGDLLVGTSAVGAGVGAMAGHVAGGMNRGDLKELGEALDVGESALIVAAASDIADKVRAAITKEAQIDAADLAAEVDEAKG